MRMVKGTSKIERTSILIGNREIGIDHPPFIIAEMSGNHNRSLQRALEIVEAAARCGVHAVKLQTYTPDTMTIKSEKNSFLIDDADSPWQGMSLYRLYEQAHTPWEWHGPIFERCRRLGLIVFSSVFDDTSIDFLENLHVPAYKIASFENTYLPLIRKAAATGKPVLLSTGMATREELGEAVHAAREVGSGDMILLKCTSTYPADPEESNLATIPDLRAAFGTEVGLSDHTLGVGVAIAAISLGASVIEKHFTLSRRDGGIDSAFSMEPHEMRLLVEETLKAWKAMGNVSYGPMENEKKSVGFRRSIYVVRDMQKGEAFTTNNIRVIRPGDGLPPKFYDSLMGKRAATVIKRGTPVDWHLVAK